MNQLIECHWAFDGVVAEDHVPRTERDAVKLLTDLTRLIDMTAIAPPVVAFAPDGSTWGALQLIAESHITIHGAGPYVLVDVFSCKDFQIGDVACALDILLGARQLRVQEVRPLPGSSQDDERWCFLYWGGSGAFELRQVPRYARALLLPNAGVESQNTT